jgi:hypothetical protein
VHQEGQKMLLLFFYYSFSLLNLIYFESVRNYTSISYKVLFSLNHFESFCHEKTKNKIISIDACYEFVNFLTLDFFRIVSISLIGTILNISLYKYMVRPLLMEVSSYLIICAYCERKRHYLRQFPKD